MCQSYNFTNFYNTFNLKITTRWFRVTFWSHSWRSLNHWRGHLTITKRSQRIARWFLHFYVLVSFRFFSRDSLLAGLLHKKADWLTMLLRMMLVGTPPKTQNNLQGTNIFPTWGKGKSSSKVPWKGISFVLVPWRVLRFCNALFVMTWLNGL